MIFFAPGKENSFGEVASDGDDISTQCVTDSVGVEDNREDEKEKKLSGPWYVVQVVSGREKSIAQNLEKGFEEDDISKDMYELMIPTVEAKKIVRGAPVEFEKVVYPGYIFVKGVGHPNVASAALAVPGVSRILSAVSEEEVFSLNASNSKIAESEKKDLSEGGLVSFEIGDEVKVVDGCFSGTEAIVRSVDGENKVKVSFVILTREIYVDLPFTSLVKISYNS